MNSIRSKILHCLLISLCVAGCGRSPQQQAADALRTSGCEVRYRPVGQSLEVFWIASPQQPLDPAFLESLSKFPSLETLIVAKTGLNDSDLNRLPVMPRLRMLDASDNMLTDAAGPQLARLTHLETLVLDRNKLTDDAIPSLSELRSLKALSLQRNNLTAEGQLQLRNALSSCLVTFDP